jgi:hypothetical protein
MRKSVVAFCLSLALAASPVFAMPVPFDGAWKEQGFLRLFTNDYRLRGNQLDVFSDGTVSVIWRQLDASMGDADSASWKWAVDRGVGPTDLTRKGGDDRNLAIYFVFVDAATARELSRPSAARLLRNSSTRALVYVWGGAHPRGAILPSPYSDGLRTMVLREPGTGSFAERVDLHADFRRAFGTAPGVLVGVAITADSDDTDGEIRAAISDLRIE